MGQVRSRIALLGRAPIDALLLDGPLGSVTGRVRLFRICPVARARPILGKAIGKA